MVKRLFALLAAGCLALGAASPASALTLGFLRDKYIPNDTMYSNQWALRNAGQLVRLAKGTEDVDMDVPEAWQFIDDNIGSENRKEVIVAILDSGVNYDHTDIRDSILKENGEVKGYDFVNNDEDPDDDNGHGTMMAGIIAAKKDNLRGIAGINDYAKIMPVKILDQDGVGNVENLKKGIKYAADNSADIINMSLVGDFDASVTEVINYAYSKGAVIICAVGSNGVNLNESASKTPVNNEISGQNYVLGVSAITSKGIRYGESNYGKGVDISAPGESIVSAYNRTNSSYVYASGTSLASANVSGVASLVKSCFPDATNQEIISAIISSAKEISTLETGMGTGIADAYNALEFMANDITPEPNPNPNPNPAPQASDEFRLLRLKDDPTIFYIKDNTRRGIPRIEVFNAWGFSFGDVKVVETLAEIQAFTEGKLLGFPQGWVVKGSTPTVFEIQTGGNIARPFSNPDAFIAHGHDWKDIVQVTDSEIINSYEIGEAIVQ